MRKLLFILLPFAVIIAVFSSLMVLQLQPRTSGMMSGMMPSMMGEGTTAMPFLWPSVITISAVASAVKDMPTANMSLTALRLPMVFISGVFVPIRTLPFPLRVISYLTPLTYLVDALREALTTPGITYWQDLFAMAIWFAALQTLAVFVLNKKTRL